MISQGSSQQSHPFQQLGPLGLVILLHVAFFYALQSGLNKPTHKAEPREIIATLIAAQSPAAPPAAAPAPRPEPPKPQVQPKPEKPKPQPKKQVKETPKAEPTQKAEPTPKSITNPAETAPAPAPAAPPAQAASAATAPSSNAPATANAASGPPGPPQPKLVTSGVEYIQPPNPVYPAVSRRMGEEGTVTLRVLVNERGRAERAEISKSSGVARLDEAARQAALRTVFKPYMENGKPMPMLVNVPISFQLDN